MSDYRQMNGEKYGTDYVPGPGEHFMGDSGEGSYIISTHNVNGRSEEAIRAKERAVSEYLPVGAVLERHQNADGSITLIEKIPSAKQIR